MPPISWAGNPHKSGAPDVINDLIRDAQSYLSHWDVGKAGEISKILLKEIPKNDVSFYLAGTVAFFRGEYPTAKKYFDRIQDMSAFESGPDGYSKIVNDVFQTGIQFQRKEKDNIIVQFQSGLDELMVDYILEGMGKIRKEIGKDLNFLPKEKVLIEIYPSADAFIAASPLTATEVKTSGTIALCKYGRVLLTTPRSLLRGYPWMDTLSHEYVHYVLTRKWGQTIPVWFHEGLAKKLESRWRTKEGESLSPSMQNHLAKALRKDQFVTFQQMHPSFAKLPSADLAQLAYGQVTSFIDFLEKGGVEQDSPGIG